MKLEEKILNQMCDVFDVYREFSRMLQKVSETALGIIKSRFFYP